MTGKGKYICFGTGFPFLFTKKSLPQIYNFPFSVMAQEVLAAAYTRTIFSGISINFGRYESSKVPFPHCPKSFFPTLYTFPSLLQKSEKKSAAVTSIIFLENGISFGQIGNGTTDNQLVPVQVSLPEKASDIAAGWGTSYAKCQDGRIFAWGCNLSEEIDHSYGVTNVFPLEMHSLDSSLLNFPFRVKGWFSGYSALEWEMRQGYQREMEL